MPVASRRDAGLLSTSNTSITLRKQPASPALLAYLLLFDMSSDTVNDVCRLDAD
ncbi:hypothetical protein PPL_06111 [Heterostelium album PN500]|uniref:Uncharacterized protein n=1 Tax=Heterostelium pallidum (strain ATCC 26659 / Pp 5 / PN500) TaxID=670386 RepID=D3BC88_HETP5|nr:hypothetical protein PPL_06111 [Heterostelium album PN500]EFA81271.1 hypothetical protein PPL_06111 [Heterostelium album PN500]|eukprot:XP_020433389.1 hypothetical protein PPL_06111 [Heterostelium album PN500]